MSLLSAFRWCLRQNSGLLLSLDWDRRTAKILWKTAHPSLRLQWRQRLISGLRSIGANEAATTEERRLEKQSSQQAAAAIRKRGAAQAQASEQPQGGTQAGDGREGGAKRVKIEEGESQPDVKPAVGRASNVPGKRGV